MKKIFAFTFLLLMLTLSKESFAGDYKSKDNVGNSQWTLSLKADLYNFYAPVWKNFALKDSTDKKPWHYGPSFGVWKNFGSSISFAGDIGFADIKVGKTKDAVLPSHNKHVFLFGGGLVYKFNNGYIFKENAPVAPYIYGKVVGNIVKDKAKDEEKALTANVPVGLGLNIKVANDFALLLQGGYSFGITDLAEDNINASIGFAWDVDRHKKEKAEPTPEPIVIIDTDGDGVADEDDQCPYIPGPIDFNGCPDSDGDGIADNVDDCPLVAGLEEFNGCPDTDGDGFADNVDKCPYKAGIARLEGCPEPDSDGDGVLDDVDKCPTVAGKKEFNGCPDTDNDGIQDSQDKCPTVAGPASNQGCPEMKEEEKKILLKASHINFETGKAVIMKSDYNVLDNVATILNAYDYYNVSIEGHTDDVGNDASNQKLSEDRAAATMQYLINKGVSADRLSSKGFGETKPISDNKTASGRSQNRRVEFVPVLK